MSKLEIWINPVKKIGEPVEVAISDRFVDPDTGEPMKWTLTPVNAKRAEELQEACMEKSWNPKTNSFTRELNSIRYINGLTAATVTDPDLRDPQIQEYYGTSGHAVETLNTMLELDEKNRLVEEINKIYRLNPEMFDEMKEDAKNA